MLFLRLGLWKVDLEQGPKDSTLYWRSGGLFLRFGIWTFERISHVRAHMWMTATTNGCVAENVKNLISFRNIPNILNIFIHNYELVSIDGVNFLMNLMWTEIYEKDKKRRNWYSTMRNSFSFHLLGKFAKICLQEWIYSGNFYNREVLISEHCSNWLNSKILLNE